MDTFSQQNVQTAIHELILKLQATTELDDFSHNRNDSLISILKAMVADPTAWNNSTQINSSWFSGRFIDFVNNASAKPDKENIDELFALCYRFLLELDLSVKGELNYDLNKAKQFTHQNIDKFEYSAKSQIEYAHRQMPISILKELLNNNDFIEIRKLNISIKDFTELKNDWTLKLDESQSKAVNLKESLDTYTKAFNFVGLHQGFDDLEVSKNSEKDSILFWIRIMSVVILAPLVVEITLIACGVIEKEMAILLAIPTISIMAVLIYFFRILLQNYKSVKSVLLQISLRKTLCRFIQSYADYSKDIKIKDGVSLEKFENVIFSGLITDSEKLPSTFDGIDQLANLLRSIKSK